TAKIGPKTATCTIKVIKLKTPVLSNWKKTYDSAKDPFTFDGVTYSISWSKVANATGYQVSFGSNDNGRWYYSNKRTTKLKYSISFSHIDTKLKLKVRPYVTLNGKRIYGPWSTMKSKSVSFSEDTQESNSKVTYRGLRGKGITYKNSKFSYGVGFGKSNNKVYIGVWNPAGTSSSYEDFLFEIKEGQYTYNVKGLRSQVSYKIKLEPYKSVVKVNIKCSDSAQNYFDMNGTFKYKKNAYFLVYANY
ncbi:MAG: hypothetical protein Q4B70_18945, partial [Lachnospiraceae bacterium]|nr:hypothetical protein [Lachnospiraceae bacterium]